MPLNDYNLRDDERPDPDKLLEAIERQHAVAEKGKLKIFLGAAPGVGKTFAMLEAAHAALENKVDLIVGVIETHGRIETERLIDGLPLAPLKEILYNSKVFKELNLEWIIEKKPQLVLVDELPHRNAPGSANSMRYQDIIYILDAGIDVYTTVNVQHLESLNDEIYQITGIRVKSTVPDSIFEIAHETVVIDITPEELIERLKEGKVYIPERADHALNNFFTSTNISALRAKAMSVAAKSISRKIISYKQTAGITDPWAVIDNVIVCITDNSFTPSLIRAAKRISTATNGKLFAVHIESPFQKGSKESNLRILNHKRYAEYMGAEVSTISSPNIAKAIVEIAQEKNIRHIILSKSIRSRLGDFIFGSVVNDVIRSSGKINVHVLSERPLEERTHPAKRLVMKYINLKSAFAPIPLLNSALMTLVAIIISVILREFYIGDHSTAILIFLLPCIFTAYKYGFYPSTVAIIFNMLVYEFFFVEPVLSFSVHKSTGLISMLIFLFVNFIISRLTYILKEQLRTISIKEKASTKLFIFTKMIAGAQNLDSLVALITGGIKDTCTIDTALFINRDETIDFVGSCPDGVHFEVKDMAALNWAWKYKSTSGSCTNTLNTSAWLFYPMRTYDYFPGIMAVKLDGKASFLEPDNYDLFQSLVDQSAVAVSRMLLLKQKTLSNMK
ncbi:MAG TPA: hypothetical protein DD381_00510 [Lentisphaeria bacterium]|nr:MAG: hypothetical protein A2X47_05025 [Lentisphaerae bacterium GWF2_38_69]HBM14824.1 hypothetical protein [Lentisphaeria bacterium]